MRRPSWSVVVEEVRDLARGVNPSVVRINKPCSIRDSDLPRPRSDDWSKHFRSAVIGTDIHSLSWNLSAFSISDYTIRMNMVRTLV
jgi:hypothetical protein